MKYYMSSHTFTHRQIKGKINQMAAHKCRIHLVYKYCIYYVINLYFLRNKFLDKSQDINTDPTQDRHKGNKMKI